MTRFARAKGSKSSNERVPEQATSWGEMKQQLLEKKQEIEETKNRNIANKKREENYKSFLEQVEDDKSKDIKWADFGESNNNGTKPKKKKIAASEANNNEDEPGKKPKKKQLKVVQDRIKAQEESEAGKFVKLPKSDQAEKPAKAKKKKEVIEQEVSGENNASPKKGAKRKLPAEGNKAASKKAKKPDAPNPKKDPSLLTEEEKEKIEKRKARRLKQLELKKVKRAELKKQKEEQEAAGIAPTTPTATNPCKKPPKKKLPASEKPDRRKQPQNSMIVNGKEIPIAYVDGFPIKKEDAERINQLRKQMISKGLPRSEIKIALKLERRKAEKAFTRERKKVCFNCRNSGHNLSECPELGENKQLADSHGTGICFKCGSTEHTHFECRVVKGQQFSYAQCFICKEQGHIARQCPDNARGLYPKGGACKVCGDVTHLKKDCPKFQAQQQMLQDNIHLGTINGDNPDNLDQEQGEIGGLVQRTNRPNKVIKF